MSGAAVGAQSTIAALEESAARALEKVWPEHAEPIELFPVSDPALGHLGSDLPLRLAERLRIPPLEIAARLLPELQTVPGTSWTLVRGFLNVTLDDVTFEQLCEESPGGEPLPAPLRIVVAPRTESVSREAFLRIAAHGLVQADAAARLWSGTITVHLPGVEPVGVAEIAARSADLVSNPGAVSYAPAPPSALLDAAVQAADPAARTVVWLPAQTIGTAEWRALAARPGFFSHTALRFVERRLLSGLEPLPPLLGRLQPETLRRLWWNLCEDLSGSEIDWQGFAFRERANLLWYVDSVHERLAGLGIEPRRSAGESAGDCREMRWSPVVARFAALRGDVSRIAGAVRTVADSIAGRLNDPEARRRLSAEDPASGAEHELLASARYALSIMMGTKRRSPESKLLWI